tara:strand:- start:775 stop:918 length:144 start_codon:yes stop_codon:yes gene_type:complete
MQEKALFLIEQIRQHVITCCAVTMEPDEVEDLIDKLKVIIKNEWNKQ